MPTAPEAERVLIMLVGRFSMWFSKGIAAPLAALVFCSSVFAQSGDFLTMGNVTAGGQPVVGATVTYTSIGKRLSWDFSDQNGNFGGKTNGVSPHATPHERVQLLTALHM